MPASRSYDGEHLGATGVFTYLPDGTPLPVSDDHPLPVTIAGSEGGSLGTVDQGAAGTERWLVDKRLGGTWTYAAGSAGTVNVPAGALVLSMAAAADPTGQGGTARIGAGDTIPVPLTAAFQFSPEGDLVGPVAIVFAGTASYFVEYLLP